MGRPPVPFSTRSSRVCAILLPRKPSISGAQKARLGIMGHCGVFIRAPCSQSIKPWPQPSAMVRFSRTHLPAGGIVQHTASYTTCRESTKGWSFCFMKSSSKFKLARVAISRLHTNFEVTESRNIDTMWRRLSTSVISGLLQFRQPEALLPCQVTAVKVHVKAGRSFVPRLIQRKKDTNRRSLHPPASMHILK